MTKLTKIVATIGPASESEEVLKQMLQAGLNVARFNTKHNEPAWHSAQMAKVKNLAQQMGLQVGVLLDLQGPEIRDNTPNSEPFSLAAGEEVLISSDTTRTGKVVFVPDMVVAGLKEGAGLILEDGACELTVVRVTPEGAVAKALYACDIKDRKTMNTPGLVLDMPSLTQRDFSYLDGVDLKLVDFIALSFVRDQNDLLILRQELDKRNCSAKIIAKIENQSALDHLAEIVAICDGVMVARGDLAVETPFEGLIYWQREIIAQARRAGKPVITATEMLKSMIAKPRPTRAEISDVSHAVYDGTDAVMLSEESAMGAFPVKSVETQAKITSFIEQHPAAEPFELGSIDQLDQFAKEVADVITENHPKAVICLTHNGLVAQMISRYHAHQTIQVVTDQAFVASQLTCSFGLMTHVVETLPSLDNSSEDLNQLLTKLQLSPDHKPILWITDQPLSHRLN